MDAERKVLAGSCPRSVRYARRRLGVRVRQVAPEADGIATPGISVVAGETGQERRGKEHGEQEEQVSVHAPGANRT
jgi:transposase